MSTTYDTYANLSFGFGIAATILGCGCLGGLLGILGLIFAIISKKQNGNNKRNSIGFVTSIIGIVIALAMFISILKIPSSDNTTELTTESTTTEITTTEITTTEEKTTESTTIEVTEENIDISENISPDMFVEDVKIALEGQVGKDETIKDVTFENENLCVYVDFSQVDPSPLTFKDLAFSRTSSITDSILALTQYESLWNTITVDFGDIGYVQNNKDDVVVDEYGSYFPSESIKLENSKSDITEENTTEYSTEQQVWIPATGSKYHSNSSCSNMKNPRQVSKTDAENMGYTPCKKCY